MERQAIYVDKESLVGKCKIGHCNYMAQLAL